MTDKEIIEAYNKARKKAILFRDYRRFFHKVLTFPIYGIAFVLGILKMSFISGFDSGNKIRFKLTQELNVNVGEK